MVSVTLSLVAQMVKHLPGMKETLVWWSLGWEDPLEKEMATHSSILAWKEWTEESGRLQSTGSQRVRYNWATNTTTLSLTVHDIRERLHTWQNSIKNQWEGFTGGSVIRNPPASVREPGWTPGPGRFHKSRSNEACMPQLLSLCSGARELQLLSPHVATTEAWRLWSLCPTTRKATAVRSPCTASREQPLLARTWEKPTEQQRLSK